MHTKKLAAKYGKYNVYPDRPVFLSAAESNTDTTEAASSTVSWGTSYSGLDGLISEANADSSLKKTTVAIIDTGIRKSHQMFKGRTISSKSNYVIFSCSTC